MIIIICAIGAALGAATILLGWKAPVRRRVRRRPVEFAPTRERSIKPSTIGQIVLGVGAGALAFWVTGLAGMAVLFGGLGILMPPFMAAPRRRREASRTALSWQEWTRQVSELAHAGATLSDALIASSQHAPAELREAVVKATDKLEVLGVSAALDDLSSADKLWAPQAAAGLRVAHEAGGPAAAPLMDLGRRIGSMVDLHRVKTEAVVRIWTQTIALLVLSAGIILLMWKNNPTYFDPYMLPTGQMVLVGIAGLLLIAIGFLVRHSVVRSEESVLVAPSERELKRRKEPLS